MTENQEVYAIAQVIVKKMQKIADKTGATYDEVANMTVDLFAKSIQEDEK